jgi:hypothetical protein
MKSDESKTLPPLAFMGGTKAMTLTRLWERRRGPHLFVRSPVNRIASSFRT